jgi:hypothetical protein
MFGGFVGLLRLLDCWIVEIVGLLDCWDCWIVGLFGSTHVK